MTRLRNLVRPIIGMFHRTSLATEGFTDSQRVLLPSYSNYLTKTAN